MEQRTDEWFAARLGKATASSFHKILATLKSGAESADRRNYRVQLVLERLTGQRQESFSNAAMQWGTEHEEFARLAYVMETENFVEETGFVDHITLMAGCSPDGLVGDDGLVEIKCPTSATHKDTLISGAMPSEYIPQVQGQLWITGREWCDFVSYDPRFPEGLQLFIQRIQRDETYIKKLENEVSRFLDEVSNEVEQLSKLNLKEAA